jgi:hypothetical protein
VRYADIKEARSPENISIQKLENQTQVHVEGPSSLGLNDMDTDDIGLPEETSIRKNAPRTRSE